MVNNPPKTHKPISSPGVLPRSNSHPSIPSTRLCFSRSVPPNSMPWISPVSFKLLNPGGPELEGRESLC